MKFLKGLGLAFGVLAVLFVIVGVALPRQWVAGAAVTVRAPAQRIYSRVGDFRKWEEWLVVKTDDPERVVEFSESASGVGAWYKWSGPKSGRGQIWILKADPSRGIEYETAIESDERNGSGAILYTPTEGGFNITWTDTGTLPPIIGGYFKGTVNLALSEHFQKGLERMKAELEASGAGSDLRPQLIPGLNPSQHFK
ncbi:MAG: SRPBCC family protein [Bdellovibrionales bacterium]|nr:SRPBCC family protein [Bdellovibrionales bacterium]